MDATTEVLFARITKARRPEDVFGFIADGPVGDRIRSMKRTFNHIVVLTHPDKHPGIASAGVVFTRLVGFRNEAEKLLKDGVYGQSRKAVVTASLTSKRGVYKVLEEFRHGDVADLYMGEFESKPCLLKITRKPSDNDLLDIEARTLADLHRQTGEKAESFKKYLPKLLDSFSMIEGGKHRRVNVLDAPEGWVSLAEVREAFPDGLDMRDAAWMIRRAFECAYWIHTIGYVHGAFLPEHILIHPQDHGGRIVGWSYAVRVGQRLTAISAARQKMYPPSVMKREPAKPVLDIQLIAECAAFLLFQKNGGLRSDVPIEAAKFFAQCRDGKIPDGKAAYLAYDETLKKIYGKREHRQFAMPK